MSKPLALAFLVALLAACTSSEPGDAPTIIDPGLSPSETNTGAASCSWECKKVCVRRRTDLNLVCTTTCTCEEGENCVCTR